jgi:dTDP-4-dehydrorhamnose reductase
MVKTAIIGGSGFVGRHLLKRYRETYPDTVGTSFSSAGVDLRHFDIRNPDLAALNLREQGVDSVLIASAKPNIGYCEQQKDEAYAVNVDGMLALIRQTVALGLKPIFLSSDYVFDGGRGGFDDNAPTNPSTEYGRQKQAVENELPRITDNYLILRLSKIYGTQKGDGTLLGDIAKALVSGKEQRAATDQIFSPTHIADLVEAIVGVQSMGLTGTINICAPESPSRYDVALAMAQALGVSNSTISPVKLHELPGMSGRPLNTSMKCTRLSCEVGAMFKPLDEGIASVAEQWA